jgi:hypothetical protein
MGEKMLIVEDHHAARKMFRDFSNQGIQSSKRAMG